MLIRPTGNDRSDFLHSLGRSRPIALQHRFTVQWINPKDSERQKPTVPAIRAKMVNVR
jgi:hypothetical protein